jgi:hypothetical protein
MTAPPLSAQVKALIAKARIFSIAGWESQYPSDCLARFQSADDSGQYLTDEDLAAIAQVLPDASGVSVAQLLRDRATEIVDEARQQVLQTYPDITEPGGGLYPPIRAEACWRDFWHFLRCITYSIAVQRPDYTSDTGLHYMKLLYEELSVPLEAMIVGIEGVKASSLNRMPEHQREAFGLYFDHLIQKLATFKT